MDRSFLELQFRIIAARREPSGFGALKNPRVCALSLHVVFCLPVWEMLEHTVVIIPQFQLLAF